jgi:hypothetical protein
MLAIGRAASFLHYCRVGARAAPFVMAVLLAETAWAVPAFTTAPVTTANEDAAYAYDIATTDPQAGNRLISATVLPSWLQLVNVNQTSGTPRLQGTPTQAQVGAHSVSLLVRNTVTNATATQAFTVTVANVNDAPTFTSTPITTATQGSAYAYNVTTADPDPGATRTVSAAGALPSWLTLTGINPTAGTATLSGTPGAANVGTHAITLRVTDNAGAFATQAFTITVIAANAPPTFTSTPVTAATQGTAYAYNITTADPNPGNTRTLSSQGALPSWLTLTGINPTAGTATLSGTPGVANIGSHSVTLRVTDNAGAFATQAFTITVAAANSPPTFTSTPVTTATQGVAYAYNITTTDPNPGNTRTVSAQGALPSWLALGSVNPTAGTATLTGTPGATHVGTHAVTLRVTDNAGAFASQSFSITVANVPDAPVITGQSPNPLTTPEDTPITILLGHLLVTDPDVPPYPTGFTLTVLPGANYSVAGATVTPAADFSGPLIVPVRVNDGTQNSNTFNLRITVAQGNDAPVVVGTVPAQTATEGTPFALRDAAGAPTTLAAFFRDPDGDDLTYEVTGLPPGGRITVNRTTGAITGTPTAADARDAPYAVEARASDTRALSPPQRFNLTIAPADRADLALTVTATPQPATTGANVEWRFRIANAGPQASGAASLSAEFAGNPFSFSLLGSCSATPAIDRQVIACGVPLIAPGATADVVVLGSAAQAGDVAVAAEVRGLGATPIDPNATNNGAGAAANIAQTLSSGPAQSLRAPDNAGAAAGDINGDGFIDLVLPKSTGRAAEIYLNVPSPTNTAQRQLSDSPLTVADPTPSSDAALADLDNDGDLDLVTTNATGLSNNVFLNAAATFTLWATLGNGTSRAVVASDFDGDTRPDLAFANLGANAVYLNSAGARFTLSDSLDSGDHRDVVAADFDLDGRTDLVFANATGPSRFVRNLGGGQFADGVPIDTGGAQAVAAADFNGDQRPDLVFARAAMGSPALVFYQNNPGSAAAPLFVYRSGFGAALVADVLVGDVDLDTVTDVVAISATGTHQVYAGNGAGLFGLHPVQFTSGAPDGAVLAKLSVDDRVDLAVGGSGGAGVFFNDGRGGLGPGDTQPPVIQLNGPASISLVVETAYQDAGATATDAVDGNLTAKIVTGNPVNSAIVGTYTVTYDVSDSSGNAAARAMRTVRVEPREGTGGGGGGALGAPFVLLGLLLYFMSSARQRRRR